MSTITQERPTLNQLTTVERMDFLTTRTTNPWPMKLPRTTHANSAIASLLRVLILLLLSSSVNYATLCNTEKTSPPDKFAKRYSDAINAMTRRGVSVLNDLCTADVVASRFEIIGERCFDLGRRSGATKGEFQEFIQWFAEMSESGQIHEVPEKWQKCEKPVKEHTGDNRS